MELQDIINSSETRGEAIRKLFKYNNGRTGSKFDKLVKEHNLDISHLIRNKPKYKRYETECPVCGTEFTTNEKENKTTCGYRCANTYFRSGKNNPNWKGTQYRTIMKEHHKMECVVCGEDKIVTCHHYDENHNNNEPSNLIPLCPTHHQYVHSRYKDEVIGIIDEYRKNIPS